MATMATVVLPALELHDPDFPPTPLTDDLAGDSGAREGLRVRDHLAVARHEQHRPELDGGARLAGQFLDRDDLPRRHAVLLAAGRDDCLHNPDLSQPPRVTSPYLTTRRRLAQDCSGDREDGAIGGWPETRRAWLRSPCRVPFQRSHEGGLRSGRARRSSCTRRGADARTGATCAPAISPPAC